MLMGGLGRELGILLERAAGVGCLDWVSAFGE